MRHAPFALALLLVLLGTGVGFAGSARAQETGSADLPAPARRAQQQAQSLTPVQGVSSNTIQVLKANGDSLWVGPLLTVYLENEERFLTADVPALVDGENVVFGLDVRGDGLATSTIAAGLAFSTSGGEAGAGGFLVSTDGGQTFARRRTQLDGPGDTTVVYGASTLPAVPITREAGSAPQDVAVNPGGDSLWMAGARSGIRRSVDGGETWRRVVLPPDTAAFITPEDDYDFLVAPPLDQQRGWLNHFGFSVLVDETGTVWAGTAAGVNRSRPQDVAPGGDRAWRRFGFSPSPGALTGSSVVTLAEEPRPGQRNAIWMATWAIGTQSGSRQRFGVTVTPDGGATFRKTLVGERIYDFAFRGPRTYAAGEAGLFVSDDRGRTWRSVQRFPLEDESRFLPSSLSARSVATTDRALWVGTTEGLLRLPRSSEPALLAGTGGEGPRWQLFRTDVPVSPESPSESVPDVETYAYPNPFRTGQHEAVRIVYELENATSVEVQILDFGMTPVRTLRAQQSAGRQEIVWDGTDSSGLRLPNGTYFYTVDTGDRTLRGKILIVQ